jgi:hypothetical protein
MNRSKQAGMGKKAIIVLVIGLALASVHMAKAQQPTKVPADDLPSVIFVGPVTSLLYHRVGF